MTHSDENGLVLPPRLAPHQVVIVPIYRKDEEFERVDAKAKEIVKSLRKAGITVHYDNRDTHKPGWKFNEYELKGVPVRIAIGPRDLDNNQVEMARRDTLEKSFQPIDNLPETIAAVLENMQSSLFKRAQDRTLGNTYEVNTWEEFEDAIKNRGGFVKAHWDGTAETEKAIKDKTKATIRCIELDAKEEEGTCILSGKPSSRRVIFAKAY